MLNTCSQFDRFPTAEQRSGYFIANVTAIVRDLTTSRESQKLSTVERLLSNTRWETLGSKFPFILNGGQ